LEVLFGEAVTESYHKILLKTAPIAFWQVDAQGLITEVNDAACRMSGYSEQELLSMHIYEVDATDDETIVKSRIKRMLEYDEVLHFETRHRRKDGTLYDVATSVKHAGDGRFVAFFEDITERKTAEQRLQASEEKYRVLVENLNEGVWQIDKDGNTVFVNETMAKMLGYERDEMLGKHLFSFMDEEGKKLATYNIERRQRGIKEHHDFTFMKKNGEQIITSMETGPILEQGNYVGAVASAAP
jgi:PAS domain S-box-containing protein